MTEEAFATKRDAKKKNWKCEACRPASGKTNTPAADLLGDTDIKLMIVDMNKKLTSLVPLTEKVGEVERLAQLLSDKFDNIQERLDRHENEIKCLHGRVEKIEKVCDAKSLTQLQFDVDDLERRSRQLNIEVHGIPEEKGEDLLAKLNDVAIKLGVPKLARVDVSALHRMAAKPGKARGVIVRFVHQDLRHTWLEKRKALRQSAESLYISENMTRHARTLLTKARAWATRVGYAYAWHSNGKILVRRKSGEPAAVIRCEDDLSALSA
ncbi:hypothetical protein HPB50_022407 [Hyalomma asiaticum]|uniref:Uncharacterized protein n=1 Tax=Hyalomma asiaticum TaxID=266040 RepID=A0ACB7TSW7_HYAAI|nr:hypothetical protein HPB50_022407 [Hyalomma asiaticum]